MQNNSDYDQPQITSLEEIGWDKEWDLIFSPYKGPYISGRVVTVHKTKYDVLIPGEIISSPISGVMRSKNLHPVVGDFVVILNQDPTSRMIVSILDRRTCLSRGGAGESTGEQILAANIDTAFIVTDPGMDFNISRIERYLLIVRSSGAKPVIILNKTDTCDDTTSKINEIHTELGHIPVVAISALQNTGLDQLKEYLKPGNTIIFLGSSGVGKSTLMNALSGSHLQQTGSIREDDGKGRHTTTVRHLIVLPSKCSLIDTPGLREIRIWTAEDQVEELFQDIIRIARGCRFSDCSHQQEPGCAVRQAIDNGELLESRLERYRKILKEMSFEREKAEIGLKRFEKKKFKGISQLAHELHESPKWKAQR